jgi:ABC-2 type transport system ATP-binding protein
MTVMNAVNISDLRKTYPAAWRKPAKDALKGVSLQIPVGETFGFIGPNGAGKSTLIKILIGALRPTSGEVLLFGQVPSVPEARRGLGFVPENPSMPEHLTPIEILLMGLRLHQTKIASDERSHCRGWLEKFGLAEVGDSPVRGFSKGMMQRTALAHAMAVMPKILVLDEPLSGLDPVGRKEVVDILDDYRRSGGTLFFSSHVLHDVERIADRFGLIHQGKLLTIRSPQEIASDQADRYVLNYRGGLAIDGSYEVRGGLHVMEVDARDLASAVVRVQAAGGVVQDAKPKASLEAVFFRTITATQEEHA